jgi:hypothetical protein
MSASERWDVVVKVLDGPLSGLGEQTLRGPVVRIGVDPGPGGLKLAGYRGLDGRHAVITAYDGGTVTIGPVGSNQVRIAPHPNVNWKEIDPVQSPQYLNAGGAIHLGPIGRGATLEFVKAQRLGQWTQGGLASEAGAANSAAIKNQAIPVAINARGNRVGVISTQTAPFWFMGCLFLMATFASMIVLAAGAWWYLGKDVKLGPKEEGEYFQDFATVNKKELEASGLMEGLEEPFNAFVMKYNAEASGRKELANDSKNWDREFYERVAASVHQHVQWKRSFRRLDEIKEHYSTVTQVIHEMDMPEVFAGIPYRESTYLKDIQSNACARGWWQFMPEVGNRMKLKVKSCHFNDADGTWEPAPGDVTPPANLFNTAKYISPTKKCRITKCDVDERTDLEKSTRAALETFKEPMNDSVLRDSGAVVQITILSHNAGYDDSRYGVAKKSNLLPAFKKYAKTADKDDYPNFYGNMITCTNPDDIPKPEVGKDGIPLANNSPKKEDNYCGSILHAETQHYAYPIVARHILAVCYYGKNYDDMKGFENWATYNSGERYCTNFNIPTPAEIK